MTCGDRVVKAIDPPPIAEPTKARSALGEALQRAYRRPIEQRVPDELRALLDRID